MANDVATDEPMPGTYKIRMSRNGVFVPVWIGRLCCCTVGGGDENLEHEWSPACDRFPPLIALRNGKHVPTDWV